VAGSSTTNNTCESETNFLSGWTASVAADDIIDVIVSGEGWIITTNVISGSEIFTPAPSSGNYSYSVNLATNVITTNGSSILAEGIPWILDEGYEYYSETERKYILNLDEDPEWIGGASVIERLTGLCSISEVQAAAGAAMKLCPAPAWGYGSVNYYDGGCDTLDAIEEAYYTEYEFPRPGVSLRMVEFRFTLICQPCYRYKIEWEEITNIGGNLTTITNSEIIEESEGETYGEIHKLQAPSANSTVSLGNYYVTVTPVPGCEISNNGSGGNGSDDDGASGCRKCPTGMNSSGPPGSSGFSANGAGFSFRLGSTDGFGVPGFLRVLQSLPSTALRACAKINSDLSSEGACSSILARPDVSASPSYSFADWRS
jgi:hypothetical protein